MGESPADPYKPPSYLSKPGSAEAADVKYRDVTTVILLMLVTLGLYWFYLAFQWAKELNGLHGHVKYPPVVVLLANILSCGLAGLVFECLFAFDIAQATQSRDIPGRMAQLGAWVLGCNIGAIVLSVIPFGVLLAFPLGILASALIQVELNRLAEQIGKLSAA